MISKLLKRNYRNWKEHKTFLFDWINLEPSIFSDKDLRPLVYLSKETVHFIIVSKRFTSEIADSAYVDY